MYYQSYDDYMRSALGYEPMSLNNATYPMMQQPMYDDFATQDLNEYYPDIYRIVYPAVCSVCSKCDKRNISGVSIDDMVDTVYRMIEETNNDIRKIILQDINKANSFMSAEYNVVDTEYYLIFQERKLEILQKKLHNMISGLAGCGLQFSQTSNADLRMVLDNLLNGGEQINFGTVMS